MLMEEIFKDVYRKISGVIPKPFPVMDQGWPARLHFVISSRILIELGTRSLLDAGCGDFNWMKEGPFPIARYLEWTSFPN